MKTFLKLLVLVPVAVIAVAFAVANRQVVTVSFDPFATDLPAFSLTGPLFVVVIVVAVGGVVVGGVATWLGQGRHRKARRALKRENANLREQIDRLNADLASVGPARNDNARYLALPGRNAA